ncbi:hypothetical protein ACTFIU_003596 [Dictyostelium citrinum]
MSKSAITFRKSLSLNSSDNGGNKRVFNRKLNSSDDGNSNLFGYGGRLNSSNNPLSTSTTTTTTTTTTASSSSSLSLNYFPNNIRLSGSGIRLPIGQQGLTQDSNGYYIIGNNTNQLGSIIGRSVAGDSSFAGTIAGKFKIDWKPTQLIGNNNNNDNFSSIIRVTFSEDGEIQHPQQQNGSLEKIQSSIKPISQKIGEYFDD